MPDWPHRFRRRDRLRQLWAFCLTAELRSISRAAGALALAPPAVLLHVRELEDEFKVALLARTVHVFDLTPAGAHLYALARPLLDEIEALASRLEAAVAREPETETIHIVSDGGAAQEVFLRAAKRLFGEQPGLDLRLRSGSMDEGMERLLADEVDFMFGPARGVPEQFVYRPLLSSRWVLLADPEHPLAARTAVTLEETSEFPQIAPSPEQVRRETEYEESPYQHPATRRNPMLETNGWVAACAFIEAGLGIAIVDELAIPEGLRVAAVPIVERFPRRIYGLIRRRDRPETRAAGLVAEAILDEYPEAAASERFQGGVTAQRTR